VRRRTVGTLNYAEREERNRSTKRPVSSPLVSRALSLSHLVPERLVAGVQHVGDGLRDARAGGSFVPALRDDDSLGVGRRASDDVELAWFGRRGRRRRRRRGEEERTKERKKEVGKVSKGKMV